MDIFLQNNRTVQIAEQKSTKRFISQSIKNTRKHAEYDLKNADEALKRAEKAQSGDDFDRYCIDSTQKSVDSTEKNGKVLAEIMGIEKNKIGKQELRRTHNISDINEELRKAGTDFLDDGEAKFLDGFASKRDGCCSTHSELSYGGTVPSLKDARQAHDIAVKANKVVLREIEDKKIMENILRQIDDLLQ